ncbi:glycosyltransferase [Pseudomonas synxantha]|uniref:Glycosyltransferase involved in cell wall biosynthesis n=1 Tax=Pseudomonas synxantha TaxID=47883 RepID=A0ACC6JHB0_9PSED|nr:glycosyltransferase [Pseudomonas synxantha]MDR6605619.1 glycosyltransferase involved in cell wall biosynthesis [Pseudomonas synxantha]
MLKLEDVNLAVVGLDYVGLPLAVEFGKKMLVVGFDISKPRVDALESAHIESLIKVKNALTIPHGISSMFSTHNNSTVRADFLPASEYILYVSKFNVCKHHYEVISAYATLPQELREKFPLILVGETSSPEADRLKSLISTLGLDGQVLLIGSIPYQSLPPLYHHAYLNIFASSCENCLNIILEALASGRPLICSNVMPMPEFGEDAALYFSPFDSMNMGDVLIEALSTPELLSKLPSATVLQGDKFDWESTSKKTWSELPVLAKRSKEGAC